MYPNECFRFWERLHFLFEQQLWPCLLCAVLPPQGLPQGLFVTTGRAKITHANAHIHFLLKADECMLSTVKPLTEGFPLCFIETTALFPSHDCSHTVISNVCEGIWSNYHQIYETDCLYLYSVFEDKILSPQSADFFKSGTQICQIKPWPWYKKSMKTADWAAHTWYAGIHAWPKMENMGVSFP